MEYEPYNVVDIPETLYAPESRGARTKYWLWIGDEAKRWLLKVPRPGTGEHWAEKITAEVGHLIEVDCALIELARYGEHAALTSAAGEQHEDGQGHGEGEVRLGTICRSFIPHPDELDEEPRLLSAFHGVGVLQLVVDGYDTGRRFGQRDHNIKNISKGMMEILAHDDERPTPRDRETLEKLASYVLLDGLVANTDRHHENWMVAYMEDRDGMYVEVMPSFDHASSLGRELDDEKRSSILESGGVRSYLRKGRGGVYVNNRRKRAPSPLSLARLLARWQPALTERTLDKIKDLSEGNIRRAVGSVPREFMSKTAKEFAVQVVLTSKHELLRSAR